MACFLSESACRGSRPKHVDLSNKVMQESLISKLLEQRDVLRYICAPDGFGKSTLAGQYAELVFSFKKVFWLNCDNPCFIRDLDSKGIFSQIIQICSDPKLVVFDNLNNICEERAKKLSKTIDELLDYNCEVIAISRPFDDELLSLQKDAYVLNAKDLICKNIDYGSAPDECIFNIPVVHYDESKSIANLLRCALNEDLTKASVFSLFYIYLFKEGNLSDLLQFITKSELNLLKELNLKYLYFGILEDKDKFCVPEISCKDLIHAFRTKFKVLNTISKCKDKEAFIELLIKCLEEKNMNEKIIEILTCTSFNNLKIQKLEQYSEDGIKNFYIPKLIDLYNKCNVSSKSSVKLLPLKSLFFAILGDVKEAIRCSYTILDNPKASNEDKIISTLIFMRFAADSEKQQALKILRFLSNDYKVSTYLKNNKLNDWEIFKYKLISCLIDTYFSIFGENKNPFNIWLQNVDDRLDDIDLICAEAIISSIDDINIKYFKTKEFKTFISKICKYFNYENNIEISFYSVAFICAYQKNKDAINKYSAFGNWEINEDVIAQHNFYKTIFTNQKKEFKQKYNVKNINKKSDIVSLNDQIIKTDNQGFNANLFTNCELPKLRVSVFGGLSVFVGNKELINTNFGRQNVKLICCILALKNGQEINKNKLSSIIWPYSDEFSQRTNLNSNWAILKKMLTLPSGDCPYLLRNQNSYKFIKSNVELDIDDFDAVCTELTMGPIDAVLWSKMIKSNVDLVYGDLLPSELNNSYIKRKRQEFKTKIVDALLAASNRLLDAGQIQQALWFAHVARNRDSSREDVYLTLMNCQLKSGQRTPAIETYLACEKFLKEDLGINPSKNLNLLYKQAIDDIEVTKV